MGKFVTKVGNDGKYYFNLKADNSQIILSSQGYTTASARDNGIESVRKNAGNDGLYDRQTTESGKYYFNLMATNAQVIGKSQMYASESGRNNGISSVMSNAPEATVEAEE
ncbi:MAG TPA: YegP family protein [Saprospiraceae bacterium]|nr:YegP family protein [Saprospiraceae bacterium]